MKGPGSSVRRCTSIAGSVALMLVILVAPSGANGPSGSGPSGSAPSGCVNRATRIVDLMLNLDSIAPIRRVPPAIGSFEDLRYPNFSLQTLVLDPLARPRPIVVHWARWAENEWVVSVADRARIIGAGATSLDGPLRLDPRTSSHVFFNDRGMLVGPEKIRIELPRTSAGFDASGAAFPDHPEQTIALRLRSARGYTTQYEMDFTEILVGHDGVVCRPPRPDQGGPCWLSADLRGDGRGGEGASIFFGEGGVLIDDPRGARAHVQGLPRDLQGGQRVMVVGDARIPAGSIPPRATRHIRLAFALDADAPIESEPFDEFDPSGTSQERIALEAFDEVGRAQTLLLYLARVSERDWRWTLALDRTGAEDGLAHAGFPDVPGDDEEEEAVVAAASLPELVVGPPLNGVFSNAPIPLVDVLEDGTGWLRFDESGELLAIAQGDVWLTPNRLPTIAIGETRPDSSTGWIAVDLGYGRTHLAGAFSLTALEQDGYGPGVITSVHVSGYHVLQVVGSNGVTLPAAVLAFALPGQPECRFVCRNEVDDDRDGLVDYPDDPGCASGFDGTE
jgi:hypothetical protein